jgi:hypothetical protein
LHHQWQYDVRTGQRGISLTVSAPTMDNLRQLITQAPIGHDSCCLAERSLVGHSDQFGRIQLARPRRSDPAAVLKRERLIQVNTAESNTLAACRPM